MRSATSDWLIFFAVAGLAFTVTMWSSISSSGAGAGWDSFRDFWARSAGAVTRISGAPQEDPGYRVRPGDTLSEIAETHGVALADLVEINRIEDPNLVEVGQALEIPEAQDLPLDLGEDSVGVSELATAALDRFLDTPSAEPADAEPPPASSLPNPRYAARYAAIAMVPPPERLQSADELLAMAEDELLSARFESALETSQAGLRLLEQEDDATRADPRRARFAVVSATAHAAFGRSQAAQRSFETALESDPELVLDSADNSPKLLEVFGEACRNVLPDRQLACRASSQQ